MVRKFWLPRTDIHFKLDRKTNRLSVNRSVLKDVDVINLHSWLSRYLKYKKKDLRAQSLEEIRINANVISRELTKHIGFDK